MRSWLNKSEVIFKNIASTLYNEFALSKASVNTALEITDDAIHSLSLKQLSNGCYQLIDINTLKLDQPLFDGETIRDSEKLASTFSTLVKHTKSKENAIALALPVNRIFSQVISVDKSLEDVLLEEKVHQSIETYFSYKPDQIYYDYQLVDPLAENQKASLLFVAAHKDIVNQYLRFAKLLNCQLTTLDVYHYALYRLVQKAIWGNKLKTNEAIVLIDARKHAITVTLLIENQLPTFCETMPITKDEASEMLNKQLPWLKRTLNMAYASLDASLTRPLIYLCGELEELENIKNTLSLALEMEVRLFNPFDYLSIEIDQKITINNPYQYLIPLSLALRKEL
ncbi:pilus assembly protein PilM [Thiotrichales bacterium 19S3-7]|nr:pilus assembly protein PilM [Thiotrichales bacterium 19S3-7]MCF6800787.1 pilus assembly protein PilM [Thiotrichales bacterium 19S3-11]